MFYFIELNLRQMDWKPLKTLYIIYSNWLSVRTYMLFIIKVLKFNSVKNNCELFEEFPIVVNSIEKYPQQTYKRYKNLL